MKLEGKVTERRLKQVNPEILTSILLVSATILALIMSNTGLREEYHYIFNDITLNEIIAYKPTTIEELLSIKGFGPKKCDWYGEDILDIIRSL